MSQIAWDAFISHASEDKDAVARPLAEKLSLLGLRVWFDEAELKIGDSLSRSIDNGLAKSSCGIVIFSTYFFSKNWPEYELRGLVSKSMGKARTILPIWHNVSREDVLNFSPSLSDVVAEKTGQSLDKLALKLVASIKPELCKSILRKIAYQQMLKEAEQAEIPLSKISLGPLRHPTLPDQLVHRIKMIRSALFEVFPGTITEWMEGFQGDTHPTKEVEVWEAICSRYQSINERLDLSLEQKKNVFAILLMVTSSSDVEVPAKLLSTFQSEEIREILKQMGPHGDIFAKIDEAELQRSTFPRAFDEILFGDETKIDPNYIMTLVHLLADKV